MDQQFEHLSDAQIENYGDRTGAGPNQPDIDQAMETHLSSCDACRARVLAFHRSRFGLTSSQSSSTRDHLATPECPSEDSLRALAAGLATPADSAALMQHAAQCDHCGPILRAYTENFSHELSAADEALLNQLNSASPSWQQQMARRMAEAVPAQSVSSPSASPAAAQSFPEDAGVAQPGSPASPVLAGRGGQPPSAVQNKASVSSRFRFPTFKWLLVPAGAIACALIAFFIWNGQRETPDKVEKLLAQAYTEQRTMEMRWPGADYAPMRISRGIEDSRFTKPAPLLEAEGIISRNQSQKAKDLRWMRAQAQAELLERQPQAAIKTLNRALSITPQSAELMLDLALSHFELGRVSGDPQEFGIAIDLLSQVLSQNRNNAIALFNRALALDQLSLYDREITDWKQYLQLQSSGPWSDEARERLKAAEQKVQNKEQSFRLSLDLLSRGKYWQAPIPIETLFDVSITDWFLKALRPDAVGRESIGNLEHLAEMLRDTHHDVWLAEFLPAIHDARAGPAIQSLVASVRDNAIGNTGVAGENSASAILLFKRLGNRPGLYLAKFEHAYSLGRSGHDSDCAREVAAGLRQLPSSYRWLSIQFQIQDSICRGSLGDLQTASDIISKTLRQAQSAGFEVLYLRALGTAASIQTATGNDRLAWTLNLQGLSRYWQGQSPPERAYQFYDGLSYAAEKSHLLYLTLEIARQAVSAIAKTANKTTEAMARYQLGKAALQVGSNTEARAQFEAAEVLFNSESNPKAQQIYRVDGQLSLARMDLDSRDLTSASTRLSAIVPMVESISNFPLLIEVNEELGEVDAARKDFSAAIQHFRKAAAIGDEGLKQLRTDADRNDWDRQVRIVYRQLVQAVLNTADREQALNLWEWYKAAPFIAAQTSWGVPRGGPFDKSKELGPAAGGVHSFKNRFQQQTVVSYALLPQNPVAFVWDNRGMHVISLPATNADVEKLSRTFIAECSDPSSDLGLVDADAQKLYSILIQPIASLLDASRTLVLEPDGVLNLFPFQALKDANGNYLNDEFRLVIAPAATLAAGTAESIEPKNWHVLAIGVTSSRAYPNLPPIPEAAIEASEVGNRFRQAKVLINEAATPGSILRALSTAELLHIATHTVATKTGIGLVVEDAPTARGTIDGSQFNSANLRYCKLAVLSACRTEGSGDRGMGSSESLVRAFLRAGVPEVVGSRWNVDSRVTKVFMGAFYSALLTHSSPELAVQKAAATIRKGKLTEHPFYWAGFSVFGATLR